MRSFRWFLIPGVLLALPLACSDGDPAAPDISPEFARADVGWVTGEDFFDVTAYVWCLDEEIRWTGDFWYKYHFVVNGGREIWSNHYGFRAGFQGEGMTTGHVWLLDPSLTHGTVQNDVWVAPLGQPFQVIKINNARWKFINQTTGEVLSWTLREKVTRNAAGEVKVYASVSPCRVK